MPDLQFPDVTEDLRKISKAIENFRESLIYAARSLWVFSRIYYKTMSPSEYQEMQRHARNKARYERRYKRHSKGEK